MAMYKFEVKLGEIFIRYVVVSAYRIKEAQGKAEKEIQQLYPKSYKKLTTQIQNQ